MKTMNIMDHETRADFVGSEEIHAHELMANILENTTDPETFQSLNQIDQGAFLTEQAFRYGMAYGMGMLTEAVNKSIAELSERA